MDRHSPITWKAALLLLALCAVMAVSALANSEDAVWPESPGDDVEINGKMVVDYSHMEDGYVMVCTSQPTNKKLKLRISRDKTQFMYDLNNEGEYEAFPLQLGSGTYDIALFENASGNKYSSGGKVTLKAKLVDENAAYLVPNQYVLYDKDSVTVKASDEMTEGEEDVQKIYDTVTQFLKDEFSYDFVRAKTIASGTLPEVDPTFERRAGVCQDLSAVTVCMLRVQGIPARLVIGYADKYYHAWTVAIVNGEEIFFDPTAAIGALDAKKYQIERMY